MSEKVSDEKKLALMKLELKFCQGEAQCRETAESIHELAVNLQRQLAEAQEKLATAAKAWDEEHQAKESAQWALGDTETSLKEAQELIKKLREPENRLFTQLDTARDENKRLQERIAVLEEALKGMLASADAAWEERNMGHDWREACDAARKALGDGE